MPHSVAPRGLSLAARLGLGALGIAALALAASALMVWGTWRTASGIETSLAAEARIRALSGLSTQVTSLAVVAVETAQAGDWPVARQDRHDELVATIRRSFATIRESLEADVGGAPGLDEQSRRATRSLELARMSAVFEDFAARVDPAQGVQDPDRVRSLLDAFSTTFVPLLSNALSAEQDYRDAALAGIDGTRVWLSRAAAALAALTLAGLALFILALVRPQLRRLERLRRVAEDIGEGRRVSGLPVERGDEIGRLSSALVRSAGRIADDRDNLNEIIANRTSELEAANAVLAQVDADRRRFFADISHEMRTPLTVILMETEIADPSDAGKALAVIAARARGLNRRVDDLLRISRSESGLLSVEALAFDLRDAAREAVEELARRAERAGRPIRLHCGAREEVVGDPNWTRQIIAGLIENAIRHAEGAREIVVSVGAGSVRVSDDGPGIAPEARARAMERFGQGPGKPAQGFGIGLPLAAWVAERMGGRLTLDAPRKGASVTLTMGAA